MVRYLIVITVALGAGACSRCDPPDDEAQINEMIKAAAKHAGDHNIKELMRLTTEEVIIWPGNRNRQTIRGILFVAFRNYGQFTVHYPRPTITVDPNLPFAEVSMPFIIVRSGQKLPALTEVLDDPQNWIEELGYVADLYLLKLWLTKESGEWLVNKAHLKGSRSVDQIRSR